MDSDSLYGNVFLGALLERESENKFKIKGKFIQYDEIALGWNLKIEKGALDKVIAQKILAKRSDGYLIPMLFDHNTANVIGGWNSLDPITCMADGVIIVNPNMPSISDYVKFLIENHMCTGLSLRFFPERSSMIYDEEDDCLVIREINRIDELSVIAISALQDCTIQYGANVKYIDSIKEKLLDIKLKKTFFYGK